MSTQHAPASHPKTSRLTATVRNKLRSIHTPGSSVIRVKPDPQFGFGHQIEVHLTSPNAHNTVPPAFSQVAVFNANLFYNGRRSALLWSGDARAAIPVTPVCFIVHLYYVFACCGDDATAVEHHACDRGVIGVSIIDCACSKIPDLNGCEQCVWMVGKHLLGYFCLDFR